MTPPVAVFDCVVYLQAAARAGGPARACLRLVQDGQLLLSISSTILAEVEDVLNRPKTRLKFRSLTDQSVAVFLNDINRLATRADTVPSLVVLPRDAKDEPYLNLALAVGAKYLVTWDNDLLDLMDEARGEGREFRKRFPGLTILNPVALLRELPPREENPVPRTGETNP